MSKSNSSFPTCSRAGVRHNCRESPTNPRAMRQRFAKPSLARLLASMKALVQKLEVLRAAHHPICQGIDRLYVFDHHVQVKLKLSNLQPCRSQTQLSRISNKSSVPCVNGLQVLRLLASMKRLVQKLEVLRAAHHPICQGIDRLYVFDHHVQIKLKLSNLQPCRSQTQML